MREDLEWVDAGIGNISATGAMVKCERPPPVGAVVEIAHRSTRISGRVVWSTRTRFGLRSVEPIDLEALTAESGLDVSQAQKKTLPKLRLWRWRERP